MAGKKTKINALSSKKIALKKSTGQYKVFSIKPTKRNKPKKPNL